MTDRVDSVGNDPGPEPESAPVVLLVDDDPINLKMLYATLDGRGYRLLAARSGEEAIKIASRAVPALVLLDIQMPGIDGYETCRQLKADPNTQAAAIIFLTALTDTQEKVKGLAMGAVDFITKPFDAAEVQARASRQLNLQQQEQRLREENRQLSDRLRTAVTGDGSGGAAEGLSLQDLMQGGESEVVEFKSTLRWNLKKNKKDVAVEKAWLKTVVAFLNTDGGTLLVGVDDDGRVVGTAPDNFENLDKYLLHVNNLIQQHVGLSFSGSIRYSLVPVEGDHVLVVRCRRSPQPVFLKIGKTEEFYVRVGPGSRRLSTSEVVSYVTQR